VPFPIGPATAPSALGASTQTPSASATQALYQVSFKATTALASANLEGPLSAILGFVSEGFIQITAPAGTVFASGSYYYDVTDGSHSGVASQVTVWPGKNVVDVYVPESFSVAAGDTVSVDAYAVENPGAANGSGELSLSTSSDTTPVSVPFPIGPATAPSAVNSAISDMDAGASGVTYTVGLTTSAPLPAGNPLGVVAQTEGFVQVTAAPGTVFQAQSAEDVYEVSDPAHSATKAADVTVDPNGAGANVVDVYVPFAVPAADALQVTIPGASNPSPVGDAQIEVSTSSQPAAAVAASATGVTASAGNVSANVSWTAPTVSAGPVTGYVVTPYIGSEPQTPAIFDSASTSETVFGLHNGTTYTFTVAAVSALGTGPRSEPSGPATPLPAGNSVPPAVGFTPQLVDFGTVGVAEAGREQTISAYSTGGEPLRISSVAVGGADPGEFTISSDSCSAQTIQSGQSCSVSVVFAPHAHGLRTASLSFTDNAAGAPQTVELRGSGTTTGNVVGHVLDGSEPGDPAVSGADIQACPRVLDDGETEACRAVTTGKDGAYALTGLEAGTWTVEVFSLTTVTTGLFGGSAIVEVAPGGTQTENFTLEGPVPPPPGVTVGGSIATDPGGIPVVNWQEPFTITGTLKLPTHAKPGLHGYLTYGAVTTTTGDIDAAQAILFAARYADNGDLQSISQVVSGQLLVPAGTSTTGNAAASRISLQTPGKTARHLGVSGLSAKGGIVDLGPLARASSSCSGTSFGLTPGPEGGVNVDLGAFHFTFMPLAIDIPSVLGNSELAMAANLFINSALNTLPGVGEYNSVIGALNTTAQFTNGNFIEGLKGVDFVAIHQSMDFSLDKTIHGGADFTSNIGTGLIENAAGGTSFTPSEPAEPPFGCLPFNLWIDPSGRVVAQHGQPLTHARVVLERSAARKTPPKPVPAGSAVMSPANRRNPVLTDQLGDFDWDVTAGFYRIVASHPGCRATGSQSRSVSTPLLAVPPAQTDLVLHMRCVHLPARTATHTRLHVDALKEYVTMRAAVSARHRVATGDVMFFAGSRPLGAVALDPRTGEAELTVHLSPGQREQLRAAYEGTAILAPSRSRASHE
jgi:hypothetical protein